MEAQKITAPILYVKDEIARSVSQFVKLKTLIDSNKPLRKNELRTLTDKLGKHLFNAYDGIQPPEPNYETEEERNKIPEGL